MFYKFTVIHANDLQLFDTSMGLIEKIFSNLIKRASRQLNSVQHLFFFIRKKSCYTLFFKNQ